MMKLKGKTCPHFICDICKKPIIEAEDAMAGWKHENPAELVFYHLDTCEIEIEKRLGRLDCQQLDLFLFYLEHKIAWNRKKAAQQAVAMAEIF